MWQKMITCVRFAEESSPVLDLVRRVHLCQICWRPLAVQLIFPPGAIRVPVASPGLRDASPAGTLNIKFGHLCHLHHGHQCQRRRRDLCHRHRGDLCHHLCVNHPELVDAAIPWLASCFVASIPAIVLTVALEHSSL